MSKREAGMLATVVVSMSLSLTADVLDEEAYVEFHAEVVRELVVAASEKEEDVERDDSDTPAVM